MKRILCLTFVLLLLGCAGKSQVIEEQKFILRERVVITEISPGVWTADTYVPAVKINFWSTLYDIGIGVGKKAGGL